MSSKIKELELVQKKIRKLVADLTIAGEWDLAEQAAQIGKRLEQKIQGHKANKRRK